MYELALAGNPNSGKTTVFNKFTGTSQRVGNWPGVTVDKKTGKLRGYDDVTVVDLPGTYSLSPYSPEEVISRDYLTSGNPDAVINIVDASNLERNLYLTTQILDMGVPTVVVLNMIDVAEKDGISIDERILSERLGCPVVKTCARKGTGLKRAAEIAVEEAKSRRVQKGIELGEIENRIDSVSDIIRGRVPDRSIRWYAIKLLEKDEFVADGFDENVSERALAESAEMEAEFGDSADSVMINRRYLEIEKIVKDCVVRTGSSGGETVSDRIDRIVTNRWLGIPIFAGVLFVVYYLAITTVGAWGTDWVNDVFFGEWAIPGAETWLNDNGVGGAWNSFIVNGLIAGVGAVLGFLPQMLVLFLMLVILEECGYMARVAFVMDRLFKKFGLSGKSVIPMMVSTGCAIPGIASSRNIESESDRKITAMTVSFMPCGAKLPIIALIAGAFFGGAAWVAVSCYFIGVFSVLISGIILKKWRSLVGASSPFVMEMPRYHVPGAVSVIRSTLERGWAFVKKAGTFIVAACGLIWFLSSFNWGMTMVEDMTDSMLADIGKSFAWIFVPLGWGGAANWEFPVSAITGLLAKETVIGTFGVLFGFSEVAESGEEFWPLIAGMLTPVAAFSFLVFNMVCAPCFAAIGAMRRELGTWKATGAAVLYQCGLAYIFAMAVYQFGTLLTGGAVTLWGMALTILGVAVLAHFLVAKDPFGPVRKLIDKMGVAA